jgi:hypothetical protein
MNAGVPRGCGPSRHTAEFRALCALVSAMALAASPAWSAGQAPASPASLAPDGQDEHSPLQLEVSASSLPRFENVDGSNRASRVDLAWLPPRRSALGLSLGMTRVDASGAPYAAGASVDLGLHWRYTLDSNYRLDVTAWRRLMPPDALTLVQMRQPSYGARVEMQIRPVTKTGFVADRGFLGFQLESGARVTLRRSGGKPMIYYRTRF